MKPIQLALVVALGLALSGCSTLADHKAGGVFVNTSNAGGSSHISRVTQLGYKLGLKF